LRRSSESMIPKSGNRLSDKIMLKEKSMIPKKPAPDLIRGGNRFQIRSCSKKNLDLDSIQSNWIKV
jgi:hypothetical protein